MGSWQVHALGERTSLVLGEDGLRLDGTRPHRWAWTDLAPVDPTAFSEEGQWQSSFSRVSRSSSG